ncbi:hypothetical protein [Algibacillus agarilyticus]|uniref:hypothetical protein n=1 Tax=Algibacillus agarilyticus TaxID=2234133 RepID=UPI000DD0DE4D|nr:hypothetical protein [Algibacillus agarilyticus]
MPRSKCFGIEQNLYDKDKHALANVWLLHIERVKNEKINKVLSKVSVAEALESNQSAHNIQTNSRVYARIYTADTDLTRLKKIDKVKWDNYMHKLS